MGVAAGRRMRVSDGFVVAALVACAVAAAWPVWSSTFTIAFADPENSHILLAGPVAVMLAILRRGRLRYCSPIPSYMGCLALIGALALYTLGVQYSIDAFQHLGALGLVVGAIASAVGFRVLLQFKPSLLAMLFFLPVPGRIRREIAGELQNWSARIVEGILELFAIPVVRTGNALAVNGNEVAIAEACNGMRMVSALGIVTIAFVFSVPMRTGLRVAFLAMSPLIALTVNVIRLVPTVIFYGYGSAEAAGVFHDVSGWLVLALAIAILYGAMSLLRWLEIPVSPYPVRTA